MRSVARIKLGYYPLQAFASFCIFHQKVLRFSIHAPVPALLSYNSPREPMSNVKLLNWMRTEHKPHLKQASTPFMGTINYDPSLYIC